MKVTESHRHPAFTVIELVVMVFTLTMLFILLFSSVPRARRQAHLKQCVNNLKQINYAFRIIGFDANDRFHMQEPIKLGGSMESITNGQVFHTFQIMSNELNNDSKLLICPSDDRGPAANFHSSLANTNISYFVSADATDTQPELLLSGDRNLTNGPLDSTRILMVTTNSKPAWTDKLHGLRGNSALSDGSVQSFTTPEVQNIIQTMSRGFGQFGHITTNRLAFP